MMSKFLPLKVTKIAKAEGVVVSLFDIADPEMVAIASVTFPNEQQAGQALDLATLVHQKAYADGYEQLQRELRALLDVPKGA